MIRRAVAAISAFRTGRIISVDGTKYISVPARTDAVTELKANIWDRRGKYWRLVQADVNGDHSYLRKPSDDKLYATYALKYAVWDCAHIIASSAAVGSLYCGGFESLFLSVPSVAIYGATWILYVDDNIFRQREAIYAAMGRDKTGGGPPLK